MKVFLTGATGFIGSATARALVAKGHQVMILARSEANFFRIEPVLSNLELCTGSLAEPDSYSAQLKAFAPDCLIHCAWAGVGQRHGEDRHQFENVSDAVRLVEIGIDAGMSSFVALGSQAEYGPLNGVAKETSPLSPASDYGRAKIEAQKSIASTLAPHSIPFAWLRVFSTYGPGDDSRWLIPSLIQNMLNGKPFPLTRGEQLWDYLYVEDAADAISIAAELKISGIFNLGSGKAIPMRQIFQFLRDAIDPEYQLGLGELPYRVDQVMHLEADISRLSTVAGWQPKVAIEEGLIKTVEQFKFQSSQPSLEKAHA